MLHLIVQGFITKPTYGKRETSGCRSFGEKTGRLLKLKKGSTSTFPYRKITQGIFCRLMNWTETNAQQH
ncbi:hypothetical protein PFLUV_G00217070 [Perca fluviatilis]|uniref:Uncharacterized protein n=1 Tax=Perca fluviatilis TaxID=8168 RepID=A0A6A5EM44_PERFL|nr:hypothetical protein PFLUV_G00217070 [Perca fluviatilis]